jgi:tripartite ATP-independent transporter DctM subunit
VIVPIGVLFVLIIGGIYAGIFTAMEGGGIGAFLALCIALALRRLTWKNFNESLLDSMKFICMMFLVIVGGLVFGNALGASGMSQAMVDFLIGAGVTPLVFVVVTMVIYLIWGVFCDAPIIVILTIPVLAPIANKMGVDLIWFGTLTTIVVGLGACTPPYAMGLFILRAIAAQDVPLGVIYKGIIPYCITTIVCVAILIAFPAIILWLPNMMK